MAHANRTTPATAREVQGLFACVGIRPRWFPTQRGKRPSPEVKNKAPVPVYIVIRSKRT